MAYAIERNQASSVFCLIFPLLCISTLVSGQLPAKTAGPDPVENFCSRWWSQSVVKNDVLYIDSGVQKFTEAKDGYFGINNYMLTIPLKDTWDWKRKNNESEHIIINTERKNETNPNTGTAIPSLIRGHMFHGPTNSTEVYRFGGTTYMYNTSFMGYIQPESSTYPLWSYDLNSSESRWDQHNLNQQFMPNHGAGADAIDHGLGFYLNGQIDMGTSMITVDKIVDKQQKQYVPLEGMLVIDLVDFSAKNISTERMKGNIPRVGGSLEYIAPVGDQGILVALGGQIQPGTEKYQQANREKGELIDFKSVDIFDISSYLDNPSGNGTWYLQNTTGAIPPPRIDFCTVSKSAPDNSSHHIYLFGGTNPITNTSYDDVIVLSMPSFTWTSVWQGDSPRWGHNCHIAGNGNRQMITVGGNMTRRGGCDWELKGVAVMDLTTTAWGSVFKTNLSDFQLPKQVLNATGGTIDGGATVGEPAMGWHEERLRDIFWKSRWSIPSTWTSRPAPKKVSNTAIIASGVVGSIALLTIIAGTLLVWYRRRVRARAPAELHGEGASLQNELSTEKQKYELQGVNENNPAELPGPERGELDAPREFVEADHGMTARGAELPGTNVVPGGRHGVPVVRVPGDDLPERPEYVPGLRRRGSRGGGENAGKDADSQGTIEERPEESPQMMKEASDNTPKGGVE